ncbi:MAG TPA: amidohydrolase [Pusillimonas sp.]|nr:amidohydrolase [Pusillimonas sp.]|tara:strand:- start:22562 stop:23752 length:1191 start_codon:yes stop_codon:yes gene_type:complete
MKEWRHAIHQFPELGFEEERTSALVAQCLDEWGYEVHTGLAGTGVVGKLVVGTGEGPKLGLRAEMDALPIHEATGLPWQSQVSGKMHACGHDGHTAIMMGAAKALAQMNAEGMLTGNGIVHIIFQPAEEIGGGGGAQRMIKEGLFDLFPCDAVFALHNLPGTPVGHCFFRPGPFMCSSDKVLIRFQGKGGHGAMPELSQDPTLPLAATLMGLQTIVGRNLSPFESGVISVGRVAAGASYNIIPDQAELELSVRALQPEIRENLRERIEGMALHQAKAYNCSVNIKYELGYPVLVNDPTQAKLLEQAAKQTFGENNVNEQALPLANSEDFAYMLQKVPGCYLIIGNGDNGHEHGQRLGPCSVHNPHYDFNDACLSYGAEFWLNLVKLFFSTKTVGSP